MNTMRLSLSSVLLMVLLFSPDVVVTWYSDPGHIDSPGCMTPDGLYGNCVRPGLDGKSSACLENQGFLVNGSGICPEEDVCLSISGSLMFCRRPAAWL